MSYPIQAIQGFGIRSDINLVVLDAIVQKLLFEAKSNGLKVSGEISNFANADQKGAVNPILMIDRGGTGKTSHVVSLMNIFKDVMSGNVYQQSMTEIGLKKAIAGNDTRVDSNLDAKIKEYNHTMDCCSGQMTQELKDHIYKSIFGEKNNQKTYRSMFFDEEALGSNLPEIIKSVAAGSVSHVTGTPSRNFSADISGNIYMFASNGLQLPRSTSIAEQNTALDRCIVLTQKSIRYTNFGNEIIVNRNSYYKDEAQEDYKNTLVYLVNNLKERLKTNIIDITLSEDELNYINNAWNEVEKFNIAGLQIGRAKNKFLGMIQRMKLLCGMTTELFSFIVDIAPSILLPTHYDIFCSNSVVIEDAYKFIVENYKNRKYIMCFSELKERIISSGRVFDVDKEMMNALKELVNKQSVLIYKNNYILTKKI